MFDARHWKNAALGELADISSGESLPATLRNGPFDLMGANGSIGRAAKCNFDGGVLVGRVGAAGEVSRILEPCWVSDNALMVRPKSDRLSSRYAFHLLNNLGLNSIATKTAQPLVTQSQLRGLQLFLPELVDEQAAIADLLDTLDTQIQKTEALIAKLEKVKEGLLHDLLTRGIDENGQLRPSPEEAPELYKESPLGLIPREWQYGQLQDFGQLVSGQHIPGELSNRDGRGVPYFTGPTDFYSGQTITSSYTEFPQAMCSKGDLLITVKGSGCGKTATASTDACISRQLMAFSFKGVEQVFWRAFFSANENMINRIAEGGAIPGISRQQLLHIPAASPTSEYEFNAISETIAAHEKRQFLEARQLKKLNKQKSGLMGDLLTGRIRVSPLLEPAEAATPA
ncbi:restriction endonuclease subunit S [Thioalkalivibrio sp. AKL17]|uniref:restriction endonuclease subunit S n=1 Tax=Thioalkalivibrio sp. AKL17 TaxID=1158160 RepID=UPI00142F252A|nr:restriction endonuclease subunit S [Thioalkalivibrio sp. AKL17]